MLVQLFLWLNLVVWMLAMRLVHVPMRLTIAFVDWSVGLTVGQIDLVNQWHALIEYQLRLLKVSICWDLTWFYSKCLPFSSLLFSSWSDRDWSGLCTKNSICSHKFPIALCVFDVPTHAFIVWITVLIDSRALFLRVFFFLRVFRFFVLEFFFLFFFSSKYDFIAATKNRHWSIAFRFASTHKHTSQEMDESTVFHAAGNVSPRILVKDVVVVVVVECAELWQPERLFTNHLKIHRKSSSFFFQFVSLLRC